jgi:diphthine methyl ester synthase
MVETESDEILRDAHTEDVALLVVGDPFGATTHTDVLLRARRLGITTRVIHNASIMNAVGACGLQLYNFGQTVSLVFFTDTWRPDSFYDRVSENADLGMHSLILLDIKVKEQSEENLARCVLHACSCTDTRAEAFLYDRFLGGGRFTNPRDTCRFPRQWRS